MSVKTVIAQTLATLAPAYPVTAPQDASLPRYTYLLIAGQDFDTLNDGGGAHRARYQINAWSLTYAEADALATAAKTALRDALTVSEVMDNPDNYESDTQIYHVSFDITAWG